MRGGKPRVDIALVYGECLEHALRVLGIVLRLLSHILDHDRRGQERFPILVREVTAERVKRIDALDRRFAERLYRGE